MNRYSFLDILRKEIHVENDAGNEFLYLDKIEIPMIQRDYAQGRPRESEIRNRFLHAIFEVLTSDSEEILEMDFIYGALGGRNNGQVKAFTPLDGQQRLTTLFLLHWYIGLMELSTEEWNKERVLLNKFTYETRASSRRFCKQLVSIEDKVTLFPVNERKTDEAPYSSQKLSGRIKNMPWFYVSYEKDPTIQSMLTMLDAIDGKYSETNKRFWCNLKKLQFYILPLDGFGLSDELYIKMNARGKQLTGFENLKADLVKWMKDPKNPDADSFKLMTMYHDRAMPYYLSVSQKMDNEWTGFLWEITRKHELPASGKKQHMPQKETKLTDPYFFRILYRYFLNAFIVNTSTEAGNISNETIYKTLSPEDQYFNFDAFELILAEQKIIPLLERFMDELSAHWTTIEDDIQPVWQGKSQPWNPFSAEITQSGRVVFYAVSSYLERHGYERKPFRQWMRVVWNIVENTDIADVVSMVRVMRLIHELVPEGADIYAFLANEENSIKSSSSKQAVLEERKKARFIVDGDPRWEDAFIEAEKHPFFKGSISFIMTDDMQVDEFLHRYGVASGVFDAKGVNAEFRGDGHIFLRALISRFTDDEIIGKRFTDSDDPEHFLKKLLAGNETVKQATREWFDLDLPALREKLKEEVSKDSKISGWKKYDEKEKVRIRRAHEALYKSGELQNWMQKRGAIRFDWSGNHLYVARPKSWYDWVMLDSIRNDLIFQLQRHGFTTETQIQEGVPFYSRFGVELLGEVNQRPVKIAFNYHSILKVEVQNEEGAWDVIQEYNYADEDARLLDLLSWEKLEKMVAAK